jgi:uncharacterized protein (DUF58 family)
VEDADAAQETVRSLGALSRRHIAVLASVADPRLLEASEAPVDGSDGLYRRAAAVLFTSERKAAQSQLAAAEIHSLDAEPQNLAAALVSFYFDVKERGLL